jgi:two-component system, NarL family, sensor histidine kinase LiaS
MNPSTILTRLPAPAQRLKWVLTLSYTLVTLAAMLMAGWWALLAINLNAPQPGRVLVSGEVGPPPAIAFLRIALPGAVVLVIPALLVGTFFGFLTAHWLDNRLKQLLSATQAWSAGNFSIHIQDRSPDEIGQFGRHLNRMARDLERLVQTRQELASLEERNRLARDLHDSVKQHLTATAMQIGAAQSFLESDPEVVRRCLENAEALTEAAQLELTAIVRELRPTTLDEKDFSGALRSYVESWSRQSAIDTTLEFQKVRKIPDAIELSLYRVTQEALANINRHSLAKEVRIRADFTEKEVILIVQDNGRGFQPMEMKNKGFGLRNMCERLAAVHGHLTIESQPGCGTTIRASVPLYKVRSNPIQQGQ